MKSGIVIGLQAMKLMTVFTLLLGGIYTLAMTGMAQRFTGAKVLTATTLMVMSYTVGGITGPAAGGYAVQWSPLLGPTALFVVASLLGMMRPLRRP